MSLAGPSHNHDGTRMLEAVVRSNIDPECALLNPSSSNIGAYIEAVLVIVEFLGMAIKSTSKFRAGTHPKASARGLLKLMSELISLRERVAQAELEDRASRTLIVSRGRARNASHPRRTKSS